LSTLQIIYGSLKNKIETKAKKCAGLEFSGEAAQEFNYSDPCEFMAFVETLPCPSCQT
jgi:hypothetical protein